MGGELVALHNIGYSDRDDFARARPQGTVTRHTDRPDALTRRIDTH
jgi:hypothetical protein